MKHPLVRRTDSNLGDSWADNNVVTPEGNVESVMLREHIDALLGDLKERGGARSLYCGSAWKTVIPVHWRKWARNSM